MSKQDLRRIAKDILPTRYLDVKEYLQAVYSAAKNYLKQYSYVRFTQDLGFGACNAMHLIINGQRPLTVKGGIKIAAALGITGVERRYFLSLVKAQNSGETPEREEAYERLVELKAKALPTALDRRQLVFYNEWHHAVILELLALPGSSDDPEWLAACLLASGVTVLKVKKSLKLLQKLGHIVFDRQEKRWVPSQAVLSTGNEVYGMAVMRYHQQMITLAKAALTDVEPTERDISAVTIAVPLAKLSELKEKIQAFRRDLLEYSKQNNAAADEILQINVQLFPVARLDSRSKPDAE